MSLTRKGRDLLLKVADHIVTLPPTQFNMREWGVCDDVNPCKTTGCIAGWTLMLSDTDKSTYTHQGGLIYGWPAQHLLGVDRDEAHSLFFVDEWPDAFRNRYQHATPAERPQIARERIHAFIAQHCPEVA